MILDEIVKEKRAELECRLRHAPIQALEAADQPRDFASAIRRPDGAPPRVIAEVKKASPSKGVIREDFDPAAAARAYEGSGAAALSVLTDEKFFQGHMAHLSICRAAASLPVLQKDFIIDPYQIEEARAGGADAVLLIAALLDANALRSFREHAESLGMAALVEVHDEPELESAIDSGARIIGINNRDLQTFRVDLQTTFRLAPFIPPGKIVVGESGIRTRDDLKRLADVGIDAVLIGETLMRAPDPGVKLRELIGR